MSRLQSAELQSMELDGAVGTEARPRMHAQPFRQRAESAGSMGGEPPPRHRPPPPPPLAGAALVLRPCVAPPANPAGGQRRLEEDAGLGGARGGGAQGGVGLAADQRCRWWTRVRELDARPLVGLPLRLQVTQTRAFDTEAAGSSYATGFVVDKARGLILTNRHVVTPGAAQRRAGVHQGRPMAGQAMADGPQLCSMRRPCICSCNGILAPGLQRALSVSARPPALPGSGRPAPQAPWWPRRCS